MASALYFAFQTAKKQNKTRRKQKRNKKKTESVKTSRQMNWNERPGRHFTSFPSCERFHRARYLRDAPECAAPGSHSRYCVARLRCECFAYRGHPVASISRRSPRCHAISQLPLSSDEPPSRTRTNYYTLARLSHYHKRNKKRRDFERKNSRFKCAPTPSSGR